MANDTILTPGGEHYSEVEQPLINLEDFLQTKNCLSEFSENQKGVARENLGVYPKDSVYTKDLSDIKLSEEIKKAFEKYMDQDDPQGIIPQVELMIINFVRNDGTTPFLAPQAGIDPVKDNHLATKKYITQIITLHLNAIDPHNILPEVKDILRAYVKESDVYAKNLLYTRNDIDKQSTQYIKKDGTTPFTKAQVGADPLIDSHLSTKRYVDQAIYKHIVDVDPHNFISILNNRLAAYAKVVNVYDKTQTYSRVQIDALIRNLVFDAAEEALLDHLNQRDPHQIMDLVRAEKYVKQNGSTPFKAPQKGIDAVEKDDLVTLKQLLEQVENLETLIKETEPIWKTSGPVETTVGFVEDDMELPKEMTMQEILDAIFYGKAVSIVAPEFVSNGNDCDLLVCVHGSLGLLEYVEVWLNDELIYTLTKDDFVKDDEEIHCITLKSLPITEDTNFKLKVFYTNGTVYEDVTFTKCCLPVFVGLLPKWKRGYTITMDYLEELAEETDTYNDEQYYNNNFVDWNEESITAEYHFKDVKLRHPFIVVPESYSNLEEIVTKSLSFEINAFEIVKLPLYVKESKKDIVYKIYIYKLALSSLNTKVTFNFKSE